MNGPPLAKLRDRQRKRLAQQSPDWLTILGEACRPVVSRSVASRSVASRPHPQYPDRKKVIQ